MAPTRELHNPENDFLARLAAELGAEMAMTDMGLATSVSDPGSSPMGGVPTSSAAPGATGPGGNMPMAAAVVTTIVVPVAALFALRLIFGKGDKLPPLRVDATNAVNVYFSWLVVQGTLKLIAYRYHGHKLAQAFLLVA